MTCLRPTWRFFRACECLVLLYKTIPATNIEDYCSFYRNRPEDSGAEKTHIDSADGVNGSGQKSGPSLLLTMMSGGSMDMAATIRKG
jgi:hypothetical protein